MASERDIIREERTALRSKYGKLFETVSAILFEFDPMGISFDTNTDEYEPEAGTIIPRLNQVDTVEDVMTIVHEEFVRWFDAEDVGKPENYAVIAGRIWEAWLVFGQKLA